MAQRMGANHLVLTSFAPGTVKYLEKTGLSRAHHLTEKSVTVWRWGGPDRHTVTLFFI